MAQVGRGALIGQSACRLLEFARIAIDGTRVRTNGSSIKFKLSPPWLLIFVNMWIGTPNGTIAVHCLTHVVFQLSINVRRNEDTQSHVNSILSHMLKKLRRKYNNVICGAPPLNYVGFN